MTTTILTPILFGASGALFIYSGRFAWKIEGFALLVLSSGFLLAGIVSVS